MAGGDNDPNLRFRFAFRCERFGWSDRGPRWLGSLGKEVSMGGMERYTVGPRPAAMVGSGWMPLHPGWSGCTGLSDSRVELVGDTCP